MTTEPLRRVRTEVSAKRVRAFLAHVPVFDTIRPLLVWEGRYLPVYYVPMDDVDQSLLVASERTERSPSRGTARFWSVLVGDRVAREAARQYPDSPMEEIRDHIRFDWPSMDAWFEEDEEVFTHPRDPHHRIDILRSSRHVEVFINDVKVADSRRGRWRATRGCRLDLPVATAGERPDRRPGELLQRAGRHRGRGRPPGSTAEPILADTGQRYPRGRS